MDPIYLDHNATTPIRPEVVQAMARAWQDGLANSASQHQCGQKARRILEEARERIADLLGANLTCPKPDRLVFTSGGTEANNLAILGLPRVGRAGEPGRVMISAIEHASVIEPAERLLEEGWQLDTVPVTGDGVVRVDWLGEHLTDSTRLVSVLLGNHETGTIQPVQEVVETCRARQVPVHTDAVQAVGKMPVHFRALGVAAMSVGAHKFQGPLGIGALVLQPNLPVVPMLFGGHQQNGIRPGTEPVPLVVGMRTALELAVRELEEYIRGITALRDRLELRLRSAYPDLVMHSSAVARLPNTSSMAFPGLDAQILLLAFDMAGVACSVGSACSSGSSELSPTLLAMGTPKALAASTLRFSLGWTTTEADVDGAVERILNVVNELRC
jgi:cysteine desulfurase